MKRTILQLMGIFLLSGTVFAAGDPGDVLQVSVGARASALGRSVTGIVTDSTAVFWNPAGLGSTDKWDVAATGYHYLEWDYQAASLAGNWQGIGFGVGYLGTSLQGVQESTVGINGRGSDTGNSFGETQSVWLAGASIQLPFMEKTRFGVTAKELSHQLRTFSASGFGMDIGIQGEVEDWGGVRWGIQGVNILRPTLTWNTPSKSVETAEMVIRPGISIPFFNKTLWVNTQIEFQAKTSELQVGTEYWVMPMVALRGGYAQKHLSLGTGLIMSGFLVDFSWEGSSLDSVADAYKFSLGYRW